jgi:hypothetical protein
MAALQRNSPAEAGEFRQVATYDAASQPTVAAVSCLAH